MATADFGLHLLSKSASNSEEVFPFGGGLRWVMTIYCNPPWIQQLFLASGHHGKVTGMSFSGGNDQDGSRYVATVSGEQFYNMVFVSSSSHAFGDDKMLMVWDLETRTTGESPRAGSDPTGDSSSLDRPQPAAYAIPFPHPLTSVSSHPLSSKEFLVSDNRGSIFLTDWRSDPEEDSRRLNVIELVEPRALSDAVSGLGSTGVAAWRADNPDVYVSPHDPLLHS